MRTVIMDRLDSRDEEWTHQRDYYSKQGYISGSDVAIYFGFGYTTLNKYYKKEKKTSEFAALAMAHGRQNEDSALERCKELLKRNVEPNKQTKVVVFRMKSDQFQANIPLLCTPDAYVYKSTRDTVKSIIEVKCPYFHRDTYRTVTDWVEDFKSKYLFGKENAFIQALVYACVTHIDVFHTCFNFQRGQAEEAWILLYTYSVSAEQKWEFFKHVNDFYESTKQKRTTRFVDTKRKEKRHYINLLMRETFVQRRQLEKQSESTTTDQRPTPPWDESTIAIS